YAAPAVLSRDPSLRAYLILASLYDTCLRTTGSYFFVSIFSGWARLFFIVTYKWPVPADESSLIFSRMAVCSSDLHALGAQIGDDAGDAVLLDRAQAIRRHAQADPALFVFQPDPLDVQIRQEAGALPVVRVRDAIADSRALAGDFADAGHDKPSKFSNLEAGAGTGPREKDGLYTSLARPGQPPGLFAPGRARLASRTHRGQHLDRQREGALLAGAHGAHPDDMPADLLAVRVANGDGDAVLAGLG